MEQRLMSDTWFLLFDGTSPDGRGDAKYIGRTTDAKHAAWHFRKVHGNPYSTGYVLIVSDTEFKRADEISMRAAFSASASRD